MSEKNGKFSIRKQQAIAALLQNSTLQEAAEQCAVCARTLRRWLKDESFAREYREERTRMLESTVNFLRVESVQAARALVTLMNHEGKIEQRSARVSAASRIISLAIAGTAREILAPINGGLLKPESTMLISDFVENTYLREFVK